MLQAHCPQLVQQYGVQWQSLAGSALCSMQSILVQVMTSTCDIVLHISPVDIILVWNSGMHQGNKYLKLLLMLVVMSTCRFADDDILSG